MKIALTHAYCWPEVKRGGERILHELAAALGRRGHDVTIISTSTKEGETNQDGVRLIRLHPPSGAGERQEARFGRRVFPHLFKDYEVVHSLGASDAAFSVIAARLRHPRRTVYTCLGNPFRWYYRHRPDWLHHAFVVRYVDVYTCLSKFAAEALAAGSGRRAEVIPGGVSLERFKPRQARDAQPTLLYSGALDEPRKGVKTLLEAVGLLSKQMPEVRLWLSGPGDPAPLLDGAPSEAIMRTEVLPVGEPQGAELYGRAWATVLPSIHEAFGISLIESLACGTPIVGTTHGALPEIVTPEVGALSEPEDPRSLAEACKRALALSQEQGTAELCRKAAGPYDWDSSIAPRFEKIYATQPVPD